MRCACCYRKPVLQKKRFYLCKKGKGTAQKNDLQGLDTNEYTVPCVLGGDVVSLRESSM